MRGIPKKNSTKNTLFASRERRGETIFALTSDTEQRGDDTDCEHAGKRQRKGKNKDANIEMETP